MKILFYAVALVGLARDSVRRSYQDYRTLREVRMEREEREARIEYYSTRPPRKVTGIRPSQYAIPPREVA